MQFVMTSDRLYSYFSAAGRITWSIYKVERNAYASTFKMRMNLLRHAVRSRGRTPHPMSAVTLRASPTRRCLSTSQFEQATQLQLQDVGFDNNYNNNNNNNGNEGSEYAASITDKYSIGGVPNGGYLAGICTKAARASLCTCMCHSVSRSLCPSHLPPLPLPLPLPHIHTLPLPLPHIHTLNSWTHLRSRRLYQRALRVWPFPRCCS